MRQFDELIKIYEERLVRLGSLLQSDDVAKGIGRNGGEKFSEQFREIARVAGAMKELIVMAPPEIVDPVATLMLTRIVTASRQFMNGGNVNYDRSDLEVQLVMGGEILDRLDYGPAQRRSWRLAWTFSRTPRGWFTKKHGWDWPLSSP